MTVKQTDFELETNVMPWARKVIIVLIDSSVLMTVMFGSSQRLVVLYLRAPFIPAACMCDI